VASFAKEPYKFKNLHELRTKSLPKLWSLPTIVEPPHIAYFFCERALQNEKSPEIVDKKSPQSMESPYICGASSHCGLLLQKSPTRWKISLNCGWKVSLNYGVSLHCEAFSHCRLLLQKRPTKWKDSLFFGYKVSLHYGVSLYCGASFAKEPYKLKNLLNCRL